MRKIILSILLLGCQASTFAQEISIDKEKLFDLYQTQRYAEAGEYLKTSYAADTDDQKALTQLGYCFLMAGNYSSAETFYNKAHNQDPKNLPILFSLGAINSKRGNNEKARLYYTKIVQLDSNNFKVFKLLANLYNVTDSLKKVYLLKASQINPTDGDVASDLSEIHSMYQDYDKAYQVLNIAIKADTENLTLQRAILPIANQLKKYNEVILSGERLLKDGQEAGVMKDVAKAYYYTKKYQNAIRLFKGLEVLNMQNETTLYFTALCYRALKDFNTSAIYTKKTIDEAISPNTSSYYALLGMVYEGNNQYKAALKAYKKGLEFKSNPSIYYHLAVLYDTKLQQSKNASTHYQLYLKGKPDVKEDEKEIAFAKGRIEQINLLAK